MVPDCWKSWDANSAFLFFLLRISPHVGDFMQILPDKGVFAKFLPETEVLCKCMCFRVSRTRLSIFSFNSLTKIAEFANSIDLDKVADNELPHLDLHCLPSSL